MCTSQGILPDPRNQLLIDLFPSIQKRTGFRACPFSIQKSRRTEADPAECPRLCQRESCPVIDHLGGSDRRHPDPAVWRTPPAKILPVCGTAGRCENQRSEASSRLRCLGCSFLQVCLPTCGFPHKNPLEEEPGGDTGMQNQERKSVRRLPCSKRSLLQVYLSTCGFPHKKIPRRESRGIFIRHLR